MGKIFNAVDKYRKDRFGPSIGIPASDFEVLKKFNPATGKIDFQNPDIAKYKKGINRLITNGLIHSNGLLTPAGRAMVEELTHKEAPSKGKAAKLPAK